MDVTRTIKLNLGGFIEAALYSLVTGNAMIPENCAWEPELAGKIVKYDAISEEIAASTDVIRSEIQRRGLYNDVGELIPLEDMLMNYEEIARLLFSWGFEYGERFGKGEKIPHGILALGSRLADKPFI